MRVCRAGGPPSGGADLRLFGPGHKPGKRFQDVPLDIQPTLFEVAARPVFGGGILIFILYL